MRAILAVLLTCALLGVAIPSAEAASRWRTTTVVSTQEGCGPAGLTLTATWRPTRSGVLLRSVLVDNDDRYAPMVPSLSVTADGVLAYAGPNAHGRVGDGLDYEWIRGWERNVDGVRVPIGASDLNPRGWRPIAGRQLVIRTVLGEARYCTATLTLGGLTR